MDYMKQIQFYIDGSSISPHNLHCDFNKKLITYNIQLEDEYFNNKDGCFFFTAKFFSHILCDIKLNDKIVSVTCNPSDSFSHNILFDGFSYTDNGVVKTRPIFLKPLEKIKELFNDPNEIKRAEEQKPELQVNIYKGLFSTANKKEPGANADESSQATGSRALFVEALKLNSEKKAGVNFVREKKIVELKIAFTSKIVEKDEDGNICIL